MKNRRDPDEISSVKNLRDPDDFKCRRISSECRRFSSECRRFSSEYFFIFLQFFEKTGRGKHFFCNFFLLSIFQFLKGNIFDSECLREICRFHPFLDVSKFCTPPKSVKEDEFGYSSFTRNDPRQKL